MKIEIRLRIDVGDDDPGDEEILVLDKPHDQLEKVGLSLAEAKELLARVQERVVGAQAAAFVADHRHCNACGRRLWSKGRTSLLSDSTLSKLLRELGIGAVPHGFRSSFRDWAAERTDVPREVCELALAHVNSDRVEAAYRRSDLFDRRRELMQDWSDYLAPQRIDQ